MVKMVNMPNLVAIGQTISDIWRFFTSHLGFVLCVFGPRTNSIWWSLSLCNIWLEL